MPPHLLPDPGAGLAAPLLSGIGVWIAELDEREGPRAERVVDGERLTVAQIVAVDRRLERARDQEQSGAERMEGGTLVFHAGSGVAVGSSCPTRGGSMRLAEAENDLRRLAEGVRRRPQIIELAQAHTQEAAWSRWAAWACGWPTSSSASSMVRWSSRRSNPRRIPRRHRGARPRGRRIGTRRPAAARHVLPPESELARVARARSI